MQEYFVIWSGEHCQYWTEDAYGYTSNINHAGFFSAYEAQQNLSVAGEDKQLRLIKYQPSPLRLKIKELRGESYFIAKNYED
jgi:hypothetical protein